MAIFYPPIFINKYLSEKISGSRENLGALQDYFSQPMRFFPTSPTDINALTESFPEASNDVFAVYDRMFKMRRTAFPHIKCEQILYYFYATAQNTIENMVQIQESVLRLMDRFDETAEEINDWCSNRVINIGTELLPNYIENMFYFHNFKIYQLEETRDIIDFGTARTYGGNKIIIDFDYHQMPELTNHSWSPEAKPASGQGYPVTSVNGKTKKIIT
jgi:hypothetical protein